MMVHFVHTVDSMLQVSLPPFTPMRHPSCDCTTVELVAW
jgi:hypothetical protein